MTRNCRVLLAEHAHADHNGIRRQQRLRREVADTHWGWDKDSQLLDHGAQSLLQVWRHADLERLQLDM